MAGRRSRYPELVVGALCLGTAIHVARSEVRFRLDPLGGGAGLPRLTSPIAINNAGQVIGIDGSSGIALRWEPNDTFTTIGPIPGCVPVGWDPDTMNDLGHAAGAAQCPQSHPSAVVWRGDGDTTQIGSPLGQNSSTIVTAINNSGQVVGWSSSSGSYQGFFYDPAVGLLPVGLRLLDINEAGVAIGVFPNGAGFWTIEDGFSSISERIGPTEFPIGIQAINNHGQLLGSGRTTKEGRHRVFIWDPTDGITWSPSITEDNTETQVPWAFNDIGWVTGTMYTDDGYPEDFLWDARRGTRLIRALLNPCLPAAVSFLGAAPLNNSGWILGLTNYPSPTTLLLPYFPGDLDEDMDVDLSDLTRLLANFGTPSGATYATGDVEGCDRDVDLEDLQTLLMNFGETFP